MCHSKKITVFILFLFLSIWKGEVAAESSINQISQQRFSLFENVEAIPGDEGLAGVFAGVHNNVLLVAGGTAFPDGKPWENGAKYFSDVVLVYERTSNGVQLLNADSKLPVGLGEGASVSLPQGLLCIGGQSSDGLSNQVFLLSWNGNSVDISEYPALPVAVKSPAAAVIGNTVYVVGGENENGAINQFLALDVSRLSEGWKTLPDFPLPVSGASAVAQMDGQEVSLHVFGGRVKMEGEGTTTFHRHVTAGVLFYAPRKQHRRFFQSRRTYSLVGCGHHYFCHYAQRHHIYCHSGQIVCRRLAHVYVQHGHYYGGAYCHPLFSAVFQTVQFRYRLPIS